MARRLSATSAAMAITLSSTPSTTNTSFSSLYHPGLGAPSDSTSKDGENPINSSASSDNFPSTPKTSSVMRKQQNTPSTSTNNSNTLTPHKQANNLADSFSSANNRTPLQPHRLSLINRQEMTPKQNTPSAIRRYSTSVVQDNQPEVEHEEHTTSPSNSSNSDFSQQTKKTTRTQMILYPFIVIISFLQGVWLYFKLAWNSIFGHHSTRTKKQKNGSADDQAKSNNPCPTENSTTTTRNKVSFSSSIPSIPKSTKPSSKHYLILDLDETLIHASTSPPRSEHERLYNYVLDVLIDQVVCTFYVSERPHLKLFMEKVCEWYNVVIFTASVKSYANAVIDRLHHSEKVVDRLFRSSCYVTEHGVYIKDLKTVSSDLAKCMIIDNSPVSYMWYQENAIPIANWMGDNEHDRALLNLLPFLEALRHLDDVRNVLKFRIGL